MKNLWQSISWARLQESLGNRTFLVEDMLVIERKLPFQKTLLEIPRASPSLQEWNEILSEAQKRNSIAIRIAPRTEKAVFPKGLFLFRSQSQRFPEHTRILSLEATEEEIFSQFSSTGRRHVRQAERDGIQVSISKDIQQFANLIHTTAQRDGFAVHEVEYFQKFLDAFGKDAVLLVAHDENEWLAAGIFVFWGAMGTYYYGASIEPNRNKNAPTLLQWEAIKEAKKRGCTEYDFLGIAPENAPRHRLARVSTFKKKFGGICVSFAPETYLVISPFFFFLLFGGKILRALFRRK